MPQPPIGTVSTRVPILAIIGRPFAIAAGTAGSQSDAWWLAWLSHTSITHKPFASDASAATI
jgi:hypothetical protein